MYEKKHISFAIARQLHITDCNLLRLSEATFTRKDTAPRYLFR